MSNLPSITAVDVKDKRVLLRADLNVPMTAGTITDATRIERFAPTVADLVKRGAHVIILTHLGRPNGHKNPMFSTKPVADALAEVLGKDVMFVPDCVGSTAELMTGEMEIDENGRGQIAVLENIRFYPGETENDLNFAKRISILGDIYVNDAFSCSHRAHASTHALASIMPSYAGPSLLAEVGALSSALEKPEKPVAALVGGAKVSTKIDVLRNLLAKTDHLIIGGGMANTFLAAQGKSIGTSLFEPDAIETAKEVLELASNADCNIILPTDVVVAKEFAANAANLTVSVDDIPDDQMALDVGPDSCAQIIEVLKTCKTLLWNGPMGAFEIEPFGNSTFAVARAAADLTEAGTLATVAGGGDTVAALNGACATSRFTYVSTAGGAFLEWLEGKELPGIQALTTND